MKRFVRFINFGFHFRDLSHNDLTSIERGSFEYLTKLEILKLDHNQIAYISDGAFNFTPNLRVLYAYFFYRSHKLLYCDTAVL